MKEILRAINYLFAAVLITSFLLMVLAVLYTFIDLSKNTRFDVSSKDSIELFFNSFEWCKSIIGSTFLMFSVFYAFQSLNVNQENRLFNNYIIPKEKNILSVINEFNDKHKMLYQFCIQNSREIMRTIISKEKTNRIENKNRLIYYFNKFVKKDITKFECSGFYGQDCCGDCSVCEKDKVFNHSLDYADNFKKVAFDLFCISLEYSDWEKDIEELYKQSIPIIHQKKK